MYDERTLHEEAVLAFHESGLVDLIISIASDMEEVIRS
jgi:hypothetical protein